MAILIVKRKENVTRIKFSLNESLVKLNLPRNNRIKHPIDAEPA